MSYTDVPSPGGWLQTYGLRVARSLVIGTASVLAGITIYGSFQGRQAVQYAEVVLQPVSHSGGQLSAWPWPLTTTGFVIADQSSYAYFEKVPAPASKLIIGVGAATSTGSQIAEIQANKANVVYTLAGSGASKLPARVRVSPGQFITFGWYAGSGAVVGGGTYGIARIKVEPCGNTSFDCD